MGHREGCDAAERLADLLEVGWAPPGQEFADLVRLAERLRRLRPVAPDRSFRRQLRARLLVEAGSGPSNG